MSVGAFTENHVGIKALINGISLVRPGGLLTISMSETYYHDVENGVQNKLLELKGEGALERIAVTELELYTPKVSDIIHSQFRTLSWRVL